MTTVTLSNLTKYYDNSSTPAVNNLNLNIDTGKLHALLGPSGCGKTTTMKMIAGLLRPTSGEIQFDGNSILNIAPEKRGAVMVFQNYLLFPYMSVEDNIGFGLKMRKVDKEIIKKRVAEILDLVQLPGIQKRKPSQLSGGQQQRVALARALIVEPNVLLLDEPLSNLDAHLRDEMRALIRRIQQEMHITTIFVTHDQEEAVVLADKIALMFDGVLQQYAEPEDFYRRPATVRVARFFGGLNFIEGDYADGVITTPIGKFTAPHASLERGSGVLSVRPEAVVLDHTAKDENCTRGRVHSHIYVGRYARFKVEIGEYEIEVVTDPDEVHRFGDGDKVMVHFPSEKIWVMSREPQPKEQN